jgi:hypothetical protein
MPRGRHLVRETPGGFRPIEKVTWPIAPPPQPEDSERSGIPPAYWKDRRKEKKD